MSAPAPVPAAYTDELGENICLDAGGEYIAAHGPRRILNANERVEWIARTLSALHYQLCRTYHDDDHPAGLKAAGELERIHALLRDGETSR